MGVVDVPGIGADVGDVYVFYVADGESLGALVGDVPLVGAKVEESVDCCVGDGVEPTPEPGISPPPT